MIVSHLVLTKTGIPLVQRITTFITKRMAGINDALLDITANN
jgi:hypothetical protein